MLNDTSYEIDVEITQDYEDLKKDIQELVASIEENGKNEETIAKVRNLNAQLMVIVELLFHLSSLNRETVCCGSSSSLIASRA